MKRTMMLLASVILTVQLSAIEIKTLGLIPIGAINTYWIDDRKVLYVPKYRQNELRVFDLASWQDKEFLYEEGIQWWRLDYVFNAVHEQNEHYISISFLRENSRQYQGAVIGTRKASFFPVPIKHQLFSEKMKEYYISTEDDGIEFSVLDVLANKFTDYIIPWSSFKGIEPRNERINPLKFKDYDQATGNVTISYKRPNIAVSYTQYSAKIVDVKLENIRLMFADDSGKPKYHYSNQMWILKNGLYLAGKYKYHLNAGNESIPYATLIIVDADGNEIYEYPDFEVRMFDEYFFRLSPDRTKILLWGDYLKDDKPGEATYLLDIKYN